MVMIAMPLGPPKIVFEENVNDIQVKLDHAQVHNFNMLDSIIEYYNKIAW